MPVKHLNLLLYGNEEGILTYQPDESAEYSYLLEGNDYEGVLNMMLRWFTESTSDYVRTGPNSLWCLMTAPNVAAYG